MATSKIEIGKVERLHCMVNDPAQLCTDTLSRGHIGLEYERDTTLLENDMNANGRIYRSIYHGCNGAPEAESDEQVTA